MKKLFFILLICAVGTYAFAEPHGRSRRDNHKNMYMDEIESILAEERDSVISDLTLGEIDSIMSKLSVPLQKAAYVQRSRGASMVIPGMGQFKNGDALSGALFLAGDIVITAGTLVGLYFLLPPELQFDQLNYFTTPAGEIRTAWESAKESITFVEALPSIGVAVGGMLLHHGLRVISANHAGKLAVGHIESGKITFEPKTTFHSGRGVQRLGIGLALGL